MSGMTSRERMITALNRGQPDRLPVTTHHLQKYFLDKYQSGQSEIEAFDHFGMDAIFWTSPLLPDLEAGCFFDPHQDQPLNPRFNRHILSDDWIISTEPVPGQAYTTTRYKITTPGGDLTMVLQKNEYTSWVSEHLVKEKGDIDLIGSYAPAPLCDVDKVNQQAEEFGDRGLIRGHIPGFDIYGQPGCWQDASVLFGIEDLIIETFTDPEWVHALLKILCERKARYVVSLAGARYDLLELGGGDASTTVISPKIFQEFVAPYDSRLIDLAHQAGQKIVYHTCGGMMPILEDIADMDPDAMETFTPSSMGGDARLAEAKDRIGSKVCMIGGFDQFHFFVDCEPEKTRKEVRRCFEEAGGGGAYIIAPSDHFFDAEPELVAAFADEARKCVYD